MADDPNECREQAERYIALAAALYSFRNIQQMVQKRIKIKRSDYSCLLALSAIAFGAF